MNLFNILDEPKQKFSVLINNQRVTFEIWYSVTTDRWSFDLAIDGAPVLHGRRIVTGVDLLAPFDFNVGIVFAWSESGALPGRDDLHRGTVKLYNATEEEVNAAVAS